MPNLNCPHIKNRLLCQALSNITLVKLKSVREALVDAALVAFVKRQSSVSEDSSVSNVSNDSTVSSSLSTLVKRIRFTRRGHITLCCSVIALVVDAALVAFVKHIAYVSTVSNVLSLLTLSTQPTLDKHTLL